MTTYFDLKDFFEDKDLQLIIAADAEPFAHVRENGEIVKRVAAGGVSVSLEPVARAARGLFIARGKTEEDRKALDKNGKVEVNEGLDFYTLRRLFFSDELMDEYYFGFSNQTLWPLSHVAFEQPIFRRSWFEGFKEINKTFAKNIISQLKEKNLIWVNDYQLCLVPQFLPKDKRSAIGFFWHIPWPTWEIFRILPQRKEILESLLSCDFIAFHRNYHAENFIDTVSRELEARIDRESSTIMYNNHLTKVIGLPMGIDSDVIEMLAETKKNDFFTEYLRRILGADLDLIGAKESEVRIKEEFKKTDILLGVDRLDYTKGLLNRLEAIDVFFEKNPKYKEKVTYFGFSASSREKIPSYKTLKDKLFQKALEINKKYATKSWQPIQLLPGIFSRKELINLYQQAKVCLVTPLDDGMNLVSKEFIIAASLSDDPGMLLLSQFAGSAKDLTQAVLINPYDIESVATSIKDALEMKKEEKKKRITDMAKLLEEKNVYSWAIHFLQTTLDAAKEQRGVTL